MTAMPDAADVIIFLDQKAADLDELGKQIEEAHTDLGEAEVDWAIEYDTILADKVEPEFRKKGDRLPGEDVRMSLVRRQGGDESWKALTRAQAKVKGLEKRAKLLDVAIGARQSTLKGLQAELGVGNYGPGREQHRRQGQAGDARELAEGW